MKFSEHLGAHLTPEWRSQYVQYDEIKKFIYAAQEKAPSWDDISDPIIHDHFARYDEGFFMFCDKELKKVNTFFAEKLAEAARRFNDLQLEVANSGSIRLQTVAMSAKILNDATDDMGNTLLPKLEHPAPKKKLKEMRFIISEYYLSLMLIQNFQQLNFTAFRKILKKHDKIFKTTTGNEYRIAKIEESKFYANKEIDQLILDTEAIAIEDLEGGDRGKAMKRLRVPPLSEMQSNSSLFLWGLFTGFFVVLLIVVIVSAYLRAATLNWEPAVRMYRGLLILFIMVGLLGVNIQGWRRAGVNHVLIFELDPRHHLSYVDMLMLAMLFGVLWCLSCLAYIFSSYFNIPAFAQPLALTIFTLMYMLNPTKTFHYRSRRWLLRVLFRICTAPYYPVKFADFWLADQLNSLVVPLLDLQYLACYYIYVWHRTENDEDVCINPRNVMRPIIALLPAWWRFAQCLRRYYDTKKAFPHLVNAGKYATGMFVTLFSTVASVKDKSSNQPGVLYYIWISSLVMSTFYTLTWDIKMDWGLFAKHAGENKFLREQIVYDQKAYYYGAVVCDVIFRFLWTLTVSIGNSGFLHHEFFVLFLATCEVIRRFVWNFFRLENEHLNNVGEFRAVRDISIKIIDSKSKDKDGTISCNGNSSYEVTALLQKNTSTITNRSSKSNGTISVDVEKISNDVEKNGELNLLASNGVLKPENQSFSKIV